MDILIQESLVMFRTSHEVEVRANLVRFTRYSAVLEIYNADSVIQTSEVLGEFKIICNDRVLYRGRAIVRDLVHTGLMTVCEATLEDGWLDVDFPLSLQATSSLGNEFDGFVQGWQNVYRVVPAYKVVMADFQTFLTDLRLWLEQLELGIRSSPSGDRAELERKVVDDLAKPIVRAIDAFIERFETIASELEPDLQPVHRIYLRRQLHPLLLCSPFAYRAFQKPLGYAGDYEVVNMMMRPPHEGGTLFAKIINVWLLCQLPVQAHRNRAAYLTRKLVEESRRAMTGGKTLRVFDVGCGPAEEVQRFLKEQDLSERAHICLLDFNEETLLHVRTRLEAIKQKYHRGTPIQLVKKSVHQLLRDGARSPVRAPDRSYDFIYCAGLFDYLSDAVCKRLMNIFYDMLAPGGLLLATNVIEAMSDTKPFRYSMDYILDWHLIYRSGNQVAALAPPGAAPDDVKVICEDTGVNAFIEVRKPNHA
jgi:extracellular factor (EF) 3-hydroxypalmitic acid methyl ester biosynthesis protein